VLCPESALISEFARTPEPVLTSESVLIFATALSVVVNERLMVS
jgi:hypothetical protein